MLLEVRIIASLVERILTRREQEWGFGVPEMLSLSVWTVEAQYVQFVKVQQSIWSNVINIHLLRGTSSGI